MRLFELTKRHKRQPVDRSLPYDEHEREDIVKAWQRRDAKGESWRGPHEGRYLQLFLAGKKPAIMVHDDQIEPFEKYIESGELIQYNLDLNVNVSYKTYVLTIPGQEWRAHKIQQLYSFYERYKTAGKETLWHAKLGLLLGYTNNDIRKFINYIKPLGESVNMEQSKHLPLPYDVDNIQGAFSESLMEGVSPILYHYMSIRNAESVLRQNRFRLTASPGTDAERHLQHGDRQYYLSTSRHKLGGYHLNNTNTGVIFELDGEKLSHNLAGKPVDYWGAEWYGKGGKGPEEKEAEDRVYSYKPYIKSANKYIKAIHILYDKEGQKQSPHSGVEIKRMIITAKKNGINSYLYINKQHWLVQDTRKAANPAGVSAVAKAKGKEIDQRKLFRSNTKYYLGRWIEPYMAPVGSKMSKEGERIKREVLYGYGDQHLSLASEIHNAKGQPADETGLETLLKIFRKEKIRTPQEYINILRKKWEPKDESLKETYKDASQETEDGQGNITGYVVDTEAEQLHNYFVMEHGLAEAVLADIQIEYDVVAVLRNMYVDEDFRGQGYGAELLEDFMVEAADSGAEAILLIADKMESNAFNLVDWYKSWGFEVIAQTGEGPFMVYEYES